MVNCTYPLVDYGSPRELHLEAGLAVSQTTPRPGARDGTIAAGDNRLLVAGPHFRLLHLSGPDAVALLPQHGAAFTFTPLSPGCSVGGELVRFGECVATARADDIALTPGAREIGGASCRVKLCKNV